MFPSVMVDFLQRDARCGIRAQFALSQVALQR
jgi:hypothetical protein